MRFTRLFAAAFVSCVTCGAFADVQTFSATRDSTLIEDAAGALAAGADEGFFVGRTGQAAGSDKRRGILAFNLGTIPTGSTVTAVTLTLYMDKANSTAVPRTVTMHKALADWGEGTTASTGGSGGGGAGGASTTGSATWLHRFYSGTLWSAVGGDFTAAASASTSTTNINTTYSWSGAGMIADVQAWVNNSPVNFGWIVKGDEASDNGSARRFVSRTGAVASQRPVLSVTFTPPTGACCDVNAVCSIMTQAACNAANGLYMGNNTVCTPNPCPTPTGGCCFGNGACSILTQADCTTATGLYRGNGSVCTPNPCGGNVSSVQLADRDTTIYVPPFQSGAQLSNGAGEFIIAGTNADEIQFRLFPRRGLIYFDLSSIPSNAVVSAATLRLALQGTLDSAAHTVIIARALQSWGEGNSNASGNELAGANALLGDATVTHRFYNTITWSGNPTANNSDSTVVGPAGGYYEWTSALVASDVQGWITSPGSNNGWFIIGDERNDTTACFFASRQSGFTHSRPTLSITYSIPQPTGACCLADGTCSVITQLNCLGMSGTYQGNDSACSPNLCPQPIGACCLPSGFCITVSEASCTSQNGTYNGNGSPCAGQVCPIILAPFVDALPIPTTAVPVTGSPNAAAHYNMHIVQTTKQFHSSLPATTVWGYEGQVPGPTILARKDQTVTVNWINDLRIDGPASPLINSHYLSVDTCLHGPDTTGLVPVTVVHLHGAKVAPESDGDPDLAFPPGQQSPLYTYPNNQPAATLWYHDHALGITRLNVYMGLAAFYLISDPAEDALSLPRGQFDVPLVIQDRSFNPNGSLKYNTSYSDHFFGDFITVNGKVWPFMNVLRGKYRFRLLNGSGSRAYTLSLTNNIPFQLIATDTGLMGAPVSLTSITLLPAERADIVIDFGSFPPGFAPVLINSAVSPFPGGDASSIIPNVMRFVVTAGGAPFTGAISNPLVPIIPTPHDAATPQRNFVLRNFPDTVCNAPDGMWLINGLMWDDLTDFPRENSTEIWSWVNRSSVTHPMHIHLVRFQVLDRQAFTVVGNVEIPTGPLIPPAAYETGWKDTVQAPPNMITRVISRFEGFRGIFPFHCHILEHEDHEMMRRFRVVCAADFDDGSGTGMPDGGVTIDDLLYYLGIFDQGLPAGDVDDGTGTGTPDGGVTIDDLLYYLARFDAGC